MYRKKPQKGKSVTQSKTFLRAYGFDEIALTPSDRTIDPDLVDLSIEIGGIRFGHPIIGSAMDSVVSPETAIIMSRLGGVGVLNLEGIQTRYADPKVELAKISSVPKHAYVELMQSLYKTPVNTELVKARIAEIKATGSVAVVSSTPQSAVGLGPVAAAAGADIFLIQSTVVSTQYVSANTDAVLDIGKFCKEMPIPVMVGNTATYSVTAELIRTGVSAIFVGIGPGAACTTRGVLGVGVPMATSVVEAARARDEYYETSGTYVPIIADGGIVTSGDICKALACGADAVMIGSPLARSVEAPGNGFHWGMATPNAVLPRGARIEVGTTVPLEQILFGPSNTDDGTQNLVGAIRTCMATVGATTIREMHQIPVIVAPSLLTEGKIYQKAQALGMYKG